MAASPGAHRVRKAPSECHLCREHHLRQRLTLLERHMWGNRQIPNTLAGCEQNFAVAVGNQRPRIKRRRACKTPAIEAQPTIWFVRKQKDAMTISFGRAV